MHDILHSKLCQVSENVLATDGVCLVPVNACGRTVALRISKHRDGSCFCWIVWTQLQPGQIIVEAGRIGTITTDVRVPLEARSTVEICSEAVALHVLAKVEPSAFTADVRAHLVVPSVEETEFFLFSIVAHCNLLTAVAVILVEGAAVIAWVAKLWIEVLSEV